jgi:glycosyltransferase involved in cell wall biosynthesis
MKVLFITSGSTHYFNLITSKINSTPNIDIYYLKPKVRSATIGDGVFETDENINFQIFELEEVVDAVTNSLSFVGLEALINEIKPAFILATEAHIKWLFLNEKIRAKLKNDGIKIIYKTIPIWVSTYHERKIEIENKIKNAKLPEFQSLSSFLRKTLKMVGIDKIFKTLYLDVKFRESLLKQLEQDKAMYNWIDAHLNYVEEAFEVFGSYGVPREKIFITYNSPDTDFLFDIKNKIILKEGPISKNKFRILHLSRLVEWKKVDMLIRATKNLQHKYPEIELMVIGEGPEKNNLIALANELGVKDKVDFLGAVYDPTELGKKIMSCNIYVLAGMGGLSINDAMIYGLPVICSVCDGTEKYLVIEGYNGLYFESGNQQSLESKIEKLLDDEVLCKNMGKNSLEIVENKINIHTVVAGYLKTFEYLSKN